MDTIKYIGFYSNHSDVGKRNGSIAATTKMDYIAQAINEAGYNVQVISPSWFVDKHSYKKTEVKKINKMKSIIFAPSYHGSKIISKISRRLFSYIWLFIYLIRMTQKDESIIVYHSINLILPVYLAKRIKKFNLILETNEIYTDVKEYRKIIKKMEKRIFKEADAFILSTELLNDKVNKKAKPYIINYGTYKIEPIINCAFEDNKLHVVYAGIIDEEKGGASRACDAALYLDSDFHIHIIGFGDEKSICNLKKRIGDISCKTSCMISYDGIYSGQEYIKFLQKCKIGLSTQNPKGEYNDTSFPSKILSYMSNGLAVVSIKVDSIAYSKVSNEIIFYTDDSPVNIANAIKKASLTNNFDTRLLIDKLHKDFVKDIGGMLKMRDKI